MTIDSLLNTSNHISTHLMAHGHKIPMQLQRKSSYLQALVKHTYQKDETYNEENLAEYGYQEVIIAIEPISPTESNLNDAYLRLNSSIEAYIAKHSQIFSKAHIGYDINWHEISVHEAKFSSLCYGHLVELANLLEFLKLSGSSSLMVQPNFLRREINTQKDVFYFSIDKDDSVNAIKVTTNLNVGDDTCIAPKFILNVELVSIRDFRDQVLLSVEEHVLEDVNQHLETEPELYRTFLESTQLLEAAI